MPQILFSTLLPSEPSRNRVFLSQGRLSWIRFEVINASIIIMELFSIFYKGMYNMFIARWIWLSIARKSILSLFILVVDESTIAYSQNWSAELTVKPRVFFQLKILKKFDITSFPPRTNLKRVGILCVT